MGSGYAFQDQGWKQRNFLLCDLQEVVRQSDQAMIDALQRICFGDYTAIECPWLHLISVLSSLKEYLPFESVFTISYR